LPVVGFGNGILPLGGGPEVGTPVSKTSTCPGKGGMNTPLGKVTVNVSVAVAVLLPQGPELLLVALRVMGKTPAPVGVPEISPGTGPRVKPPGKSVASKLIGLLSAVI
jgi:hypothetical protein